MRFQIGGFEKCSLSDWPGKMSAVVFTAGCNWNCWYCHNKRLNEGELHINTEEVLSYLRARRDMLDAVVVTGGEPTIQEDLEAFLRELRSMGYFIKLDTNGSSSDVVRRIVQNDLADYFAVDLKGPPELHEAITGASFGNTRRTIAYLQNQNINFEVRTTMIPAIGQLELQRMITLICPVPMYALQLYIPTDGSAPPRGKEELKEMARAVQGRQPIITVRA